MIKTIIAIKNHSDLHLFLTYIIEYQKVIDLLTFLCLWHLLNKFTWKVVKHATLLHHTENIVQNMMHFNLISTWPVPKLHTIPDNELYHCDALSETSPLGYSLWSSCSETYCDSCSWSCLVNLMLCSRWRPTTLTQSDSSITQIETFWTYGNLLNSIISDILGFMARVLLELSLKLLHDQFPSNNELLHSLGSDNNETVISKLVN